MSRYQTVLEVIEAVDAKLDTEEKWTKGSYARSQNLTKVPENSPMACKWCLAGAVISVTEMRDESGIADEVGDKTLKFLSKLIQLETGSDMIHLWNDSGLRTFQDVKNLLKNAKENLSNA